MQQKIKLALLAALALFMYSCGDTGNTNPETPIDYFSVKEGDHFIYNTYTLDDNNVENFDSIDSAYVGALENWNGQQCNPATFYSFDPKDNDFEKTGSFKMYNTKEQAFFSGNFLSSTLEGFLKMMSEDIGNVLSTVDNSWAKVIDLSKDSFSILPKDIEITDVPMTADLGVGNMPGVDPGKITLDISYNADVIKQPSKQFNDKMKNKSVNAVTAKISHKVKLRIKFEKAVMGMKELPLKDPYIKFDQYITFAEGIGLVKEYVPDQKVSLTATIAGVNVKVTKYDIGGYVKKLLRYKKDK